MMNYTLSIDPSIVRLLHLMQIIDSWLHTLTLC